MKKVIIFIAFLATSVSLQANNFNMPGMGNNNGSGFNMPNMNWGNGTNGNNGFNNGSSWSMPNMNWGSGNNNQPWNFSNGNNQPWNFGNRNNQPWNFGNGNNQPWNFSNGNNQPWNFSNGNNQPWNFGNSFRNNGVNAPTVQYRAPNRPVAPQFIPRINPQNKTQAAPVARNPVVKAAPAVQAKVQTNANKIPTPSEVKGTILAPANKVKVEATK